MADPVRQHVDTWRQAGAELSKVLERELQKVDTREAVRQLFGGNTLLQDATRLTSSGLVEQQAWFAKVRQKQIARP